MASVAFAGLTMVITRAVGTAGIKSSPGPVSGRVKDGTDPECACFRKVGIYLEANSCTDDRCLGIN